MNKFNLGNFKAPADMAAQTVEVPQWVLDSSDKVKLGHQVALDMHDEIKACIEDGEPLGVKERKLVLARIAKEIGVDRSYLTERRTPEFCLFINDMNEDLDKAWSKGKSYAKGKTYTKADLRKELTKYKRLYKEERDKNYSEAIVAILESELYEKNQQMAKKYADLQVDNRKLNEKVATLTDRLRSYVVKGVE